MNDKKYNSLDSVLHKITVDSLRISDEDEKKYKKNFKEVLESIVNEMKTDEVFKCLFKNIWYAGSSYENLKISSPDEYDINLIFVWPGNSCQVVSDKDQPGYVKLKIDVNDPSLKKIRADPNVEKKLNKWIDNKGFFLRNKFRDWMQGMVFKALGNISIHDTEIKQSASGPAITLKVSQKHENIVYSVDLVPAFIFNEKDLPTPPIRQIPSGVTCKEWTVVPKAPMTEKEPVFWKTSFFMQEKELMNNRLVMKHVIKLIKLLRDQEKWSDLYSYAIKSVFLWECEKKDVDFWQKGLGSIFMLMLHKLSEYLENGKIPYYWDKKLNLIEKMKPSTKTIISHRINAIVKKIDANLNNDPNIIKSYFCREFNKEQKDFSEDSNTSLSEDLIDFSLENASGPSTSATSTPILSTLLISNALANTPMESVTMNSPLETKLSPLICETNSKDKNLWKIGEKTLAGNNTSGDDIVAGKDSFSISQMLSLIFEEQKEMKQYLMSMFEHFSKETRVLHQEITDLKEQLKNKISTPDTSFL